jgi:hypothetical protein
MDGGLDHGLKNVLIYLLSPKSAFYAEESLFSRFFDIKTIRGAPDRAGGLIGRGKVAAAQLRLPDRKKLGPL